MSSSLGWMPHDRKIKTLADELKYALRKRYGDPVNTTLTENDMEFLAGLEAGDVKDASKLIEALGKHGTIDVKECW